MPRDLSGAAATLPTARPRLPSARAIQPYLREIDGNRWYSNHGPLSRRFGARLAEFWGVPTPAVTLVCNATAGLSLALQGSGATPGGRCLMPSWTFVASAAAVRAAGLVPHFVDVRADTWALDPGATLALARQHGAAAILVVAPFGAPIDLAAWDRVQEEAGIPVVIDAAAAFDTLRNEGPMRPGRCPIAVSLHATKVLGVGEGGAVICRDTVVMERIRRSAQFGFLGTREATVSGVNAKLSEYGAAVGLAALDGWHDTRALWSAVTAGYRPRLRLVPGLGVTPGFGEGWVASTLTVLWPDAAERAGEALARVGVSTLRWWGGGCHAQPAYRNCPSAPLPVTEALAALAIGIPFYQDLSQVQLDRVCLAMARECGSAERARGTTVPAMAMA